MEEEEPDFRAGPYEVYLKRSYVSVMYSYESTTQVRVFKRIDGELQKVEFYDVTHPDTAKWSAAEFLIRALTEDWP